VSGTRRPLAATRPSPTDWVAAGWFEGRTSASFLDDCAERIPERTAVVEGDHRLTYGELAAAASGVARQLAADGLRPGDVATLQLPNWWEVCVVYQAVSRLGCVVNPVVPIYRQRELAFILAQADPRAVVIPHRFRGFDYVEMFTGLLDDRPGRPSVYVVRPEGPLPAGFVALDPGPDADPLAPVGEPDDVCLLLYTSGTTADPKGVLHSHDTLVYEVRSIIDLCRLDGGDTVFMPSPLTHITGFLYGLLLPSVTGAAVVLVDRFEPAAALEVVEREACRFTVAATPFLHGLVAEYGRRGHGTTLAHFLCGGADVPPDLVRRAVEVLGCHVARIYGSSEFPTFSSGRPGDGPEIGADTDGVPIGPAEGRVRDDGELEVRGPDLFLGYLDPSLNTEAFSADGYFRTGDLAAIDDQGAVTIAGRQKDIIIRGGENISAKEVEDLLFTHPAVAQVAIVAMPDPVLTERGCAFVVPAEGAELTLDDLTAHLEAAQLARQKFPERLELVAELPMTASGKVQKFVLRDLIQERLATEGGPVPR